MSHEFHNLLSTQTLIAARCDRCYKLVAVYEKDTACLECQTTGGVWRSKGAVPMRNTSTAARE